MFVSGDTAGACVRAPASLLRAGWHAARGAAGEFAALSSAARHYRDRIVAPLLDDLDPRLERAPVVLVHGAGHAPGAWIGLARRLEAAGFHDLRTVSYSLTDSIEQITTMIDRVARDAAAHASAGPNPHPRVHVVAHSFGGIAARVWHDFTGAATITASAVTLGTPHGGTRWAGLPFVPRALRRLAPGSHLLDALDAAGPIHGRWTTIAGSLDALVPPSCAHLAEAQNVTIDGVGHVGLLSSPVAGGHVCFALLAAESGGFARGAPGNPLHGSRRTAPSTIDGSSTGR